MRAGGAGARCGDVTSPDALGTPVSIGRPHSHASTSEPTSRYGLAVSEELQRLGRAQYVQLTTWRKNGKAVRTPTWVAADDEALYVWSEFDSGKVKRVRAGSRAEVTECDLRGQKTRGATVGGKPRLLDAEGSERVRKLIIKKYGIIGFLTIYGSILRGGRKRTIGIAITLDE